MNLYKFRTVTTNNLTSLANCQIWFSTLKDFNDPFEGAYILKNELSSELLSHFHPKTTDEIGEESYNSMISDMGLAEHGVTKEKLFERIMEHDFNKLISIIHNSKIACFSVHDNKSDPIYENLMWSHYTDGLRGFCLVFDYDEILKTLCSSSEKAMRPIKIQYRDSPNHISLQSFAESKHGLNLSDEDFIEEATNTIATKSKSWVYENEMRLLTLNKDNYHTYSPNNLKKIVLGEKMPTEQQKLIIDIVRSSNPNVQISRAKLKKNSYKIDIEN